MRFGERKSDGSPAFFARIPLCLGLLDLAVNAVETSLNQPKKSPPPSWKKCWNKRGRRAGLPSRSSLPRAAEWGDTVRGVTPSPVYVIEALPKESVRIISGLKKLSSLGLVDLQIGAEGARALASLSALTSLHLSSNKIGDEGARALLEAWIHRPTSGKLKLSRSAE